MKIKDLEKRVEAAEEKVEKCKKTIARHTIQLEKKAAQLRALGIDPETADKEEIAKKRNVYGDDAYWLFCEYGHKKEDISGAVDRLAAAERICSNWKVMLDTEINKEKVIQDQVPEAMKRFLQTWKENAFGWYVERYDEFIVFRKNLRETEREAKRDALRTLPEYASLRERVGDRLFQDDYYLNNPWPRNPMEAYLKERQLDYNSIVKKIKGFADPILLKMVECRNPEDRLKLLEDLLEEEKKAKTLDLVGRVTKITGPITDVQELHLSAGDLNGVVLGEKGAAKVQTISAGGYNIQCFHFRCLIDDVTKKYMVNSSEKKPSLDVLIQTAAGKEERPLIGLEQVAHER